MLRRWSAAGIANIAKRPYTAGCGVRLDRVKEKSYWKIFTANAGKGKKVPTMTEYIKNPLSGKLRGVTYEDGKIIDVHIRDTDDVVKVFVPVRNGRWIQQPLNGTHIWRCSKCETLGSPQWNYCPKCGAKMGDKLYG